MVGGCDSDVDFLFSPKINDFSFVEFIGFVSSKIMYSATGKRWEINKTLDNKIVAYMNSTSNLPIGTHPWYFTKSNCTDEGKMYRTLNFHKYVEQPGNFCCNDGTCFTSEFVCDGIPQCNSEEDENEANCEFIDIPKYYEKYVPRKEVFINLSIVDIMTIDQDQSSFDVFFQIKMRWFDNKLMFHYLKDNDYANILAEDEKAKIWTPNIDFALQRKSYKDYDDKIYVQKMTRPKMTNLHDNDIYARETYDGRYNPLLHVSDHNMKFFCGFDGISLYPFEIETCSFYFYLIGPANNLTKINIVNFEAPSENIIGRYFISEWKYQSGETYPRSESKMVKVSVYLRKDPISIFMVTYLPTILMNIINQATNHIRGVELQTNNEGSQIFI